MVEDQGRVGFGLGGGRGLIDVGKSLGAEGRDYLLLFGCKMICLIQ